MSELADFLTQTITVTTRLGVGGMGETWGSPVSVQGVFVDGKRQLVRGERSEQVVSSSQVYDDQLDRESLYRPGSRVTLPGGQEALVISVARLEDPGLELPSHLVVSLT